MHRAALESLDKEALIRLVLAQAEMIEKLSARVAELEAKAPSVNNGIGWFGQDAAIGRMPART